MAFFPSAVTMPGINLTLWTSVGFLRLVQETIENQIKRRRAGKGTSGIGRKENALFINPKAPKIRPEQVAIIVPARNEELVIERTVKPLKDLTSPKHVYVVSDGSTDRTAQIAKSHGVNVLELSPNRGKAGALKETMRHFKLLEKYELIFFVDADTQIDKNFFKHALPYFNDPNVACFAGYGKTDWTPHIIPKLSMYYVAYRDRLYRILQFCIRYGQTWKWTNYSYIVPGFASIYRSRVLKKLTIDPPGLIIEDFNMTFEIHHKNLGLITHHPSSFGVAQDPDNLRDYWKQVIRWSIGFWQTVRYHGFWPGFFWAFLGLFIIEVGINALFFLFLPILIFLLYAPQLTSILPPWVAHFSLSLGQTYSVFDIVVGILVLDYAVTLLVAIFERRPLLAFYGLFFLPLRYIDAIAFFWGLWKGLTTTTPGSWVPVARRQG